MEEENPERFRWVGAPCVRAVGALALQTAAFLVSSPVN